MTDILYKTPPPHRTHHDPTFDLSPATFVFTLAIVKQKYRDRITTHHNVATKYIFGAGHKRELLSLNIALDELEAIAENGDQQCPDTVAATFADAMGESIYNSFIKVHCEKCGADYDSRSVVSSKWVVDKGDGSGSTGWRLACPKQHVLYASISSVAD